MIKIFKFIVISLFGLYASVSAHAYDVSAYFLDVNMERISVSPNGKYVAVYDVPRDAGLFSDGRVIIRSTQTGNVKYEIPLSNRDVKWVAWVNDDRLAVYAHGFRRLKDIPKKRRKSKKKDQEAEDISNRKIAVDVYNIKTGKTAYTAYQHNYLRSDINLPQLEFLGADSKREVLTVKHTQADKIKLLSLRKGNKKEPKTLATGTQKTLTWLLDSNLLPTSRVDQGDTSFTRKYFRQESGRKTWRHYYTAYSLDSRSKVLVPPETSDVYQALHREGHENVTGLYSMSIGEQFPLRTIYKHKQFDLAGAKYFGASRELFYAYWWNDTLERKWFDDRREASAARLEAKLPARSNWHIEHVSFDNSGVDTAWLIRHESIDRSPSISVWNVNSGTLATVQAGTTRIDNATIPIKRRVDYTAADGKSLFGYFTPGTRPSRHGLYTGPAQLLVLPHGGPVERDHLEWDAWSLHFASLGYDVFQPQFRGSGGFGSAFEQAGHRQWGRKMQTDIEDGVQALIAKGLIRKTALRAIMGKDYGGYAALVAAAHTPDKYKCISTISAISSLPDLLEHYDLSDPEQRYTYYQWETLIGDPSKNREALLDVSPSQYAEDIKGELFLVHGRKDDVIQVRQSEIMHEAAIKAGVKSQLVRFRQMGHSNWDQEQEYDILSAVDGFIQRCMRPPPPQPKQALIVEEADRLGVLQKRGKPRPKRTGVEVE